MNRIRFFAARGGGGRRQRHPVHPPVPSGWLRAGALFGAFALLVGCGGEDATYQKIRSIDCAGDPRALWEAEPVLQHRSGAELHQFWVLGDRPDLWESEAPSFEPLARYRQKFREVVADTSPLALIRANRERNPWLEREHPAERRINRLVEAGVGRHRPMSCLETHLLAYQASRFPLYEQPSEIVALILLHGSREQVKVYTAADGDANPPKPDPALEAIASDLEEGWRLYGVFHNHTFVHSEDRGLLPVAAPSASDVQVSVALGERFGLELVLVSDGFSTLELTPEELGQLQRAAEGVD